ncbi:MAG TPA: biofilm regulation phosphoprotein SiaC [Armatimonadota bacterium]
MTDLNYEATTSTPQVDGCWETGVLEMRGDSYPEHSYRFFVPVLDWVARRLADGEVPLVVELHLLYMNTSSVKSMMDLFDMLEEAHAHGHPVSVSWYYDPENERIAELATEFKEDYTFPFEVLRRGA